MELRLLNRDDCCVLAEAIGESPFTITAVHNLLRGRCRAWSIGEPACFAAAVIQMNDLPEEPEGYGRPELIWQALQQAQGYDCVNVSWDNGPALVDVMRRQAGIDPHLYPDLYHVLTKAAARYECPHVRLLTLADAPLMRRMGDLDLGHDGYDTPEAAVTEGVFAAGLVDGRIVAAVKATSIGRRYANIGAETHPVYRRRGICTAAASLVARQLQERGLVPVWSAGSGNAASLRVAAKLGFESCGKKVYVVKDPQRLAKRLADSP